MNYHPRDPLGGDLLAQLYFTYRLEVPDMTYTVEDFKRDTLRLRIAHLHELDPADIQAILDQIPVEERIRGLDPQEVARRLAPEERLHGLAPEERLRGLDAEERLRDLDPAVVAEWLKRRGH